MHEILPGPSLIFAIYPVSAGQARTAAALPEGRRLEPQSGERVPERCISDLQGACDNGLHGSLSWSVFVDVLKLRTWIDLAVSRGKNVGGVPKCRMVDAKGEPFER